MLGFLLSVGVARAQGTFYGIKGGLTIANQQWNDFEREPLLAYHAILSAESLPRQGRFSLFAQLGYHVKGSSIRRAFAGNPFGVGVFRLPSQKFEFYNIGLTLGAKQRLTDDPNASFYYLFGIRGDYTVDTNLDEYNTFVDEVNSGSSTIVVSRNAFPLDVYYNGSTLLGVRRINYGLTVGGGYEMMFSQYIGALIEFTVNPDFSLQYQQPRIENAVNPFNPNSNTVIPERRIRNLTFELTVGLRFLRKVEYID
ncbi:MAG: hypothetical protein D6772_00155 [Bacteroidetes bacterium]|nr:MAG: hypothetical protein D6772_00155 [Bacteroidota bacterium]